MLSHNLVYDTHIQKASEPPGLRPRFAFLWTIDDRQLHFILRAINMKPMNRNTRNMYFYIFFVNILKLYTSKPTCFCCPVYGIPPVPSCGALPDHLFPFITAVASSRFDRVDVISTLYTYYIIRGFYFVFSKEIYWKERTYFENNSP